VPASAKPAEFAIRPDDDAILCGAIPDDVYVISGDYYRVAPDLAVDADEPLIPERFQMAIVWLAVKSYAGYEEAGGLYTHAGIQYNKSHGPLLINQLPAIGLGGPLA
jgi:hypothetical protein